MVWRDARATLAQFVDDGEIDPDAFWQRVKTNLQAGPIRMLFVVDDIPPELRRIVEFLNQQMDPAEVLAVELRQYAGQGLFPMAAPTGGTLLIASWLVLALSALWPRRV